MINKIPFNREKVHAEAQKLAIGNNIFHARKYRGYSQSELAELVSSSQKYISEIENGDKNFGVTILYSISKALNVSPTLLGNISTNWKLIEYFDYILKKLGEIDGFLKANKLCYFTELESMEKFQTKLLGISMERLYRGPFSKEIYIVREIFETELYFNDEAEREIEKIYNSNEFKTYTILTENEINFIDGILEKYGKLSPGELENMTYETEPMKKLKATKGGNQHLHAVLF